MNNVGFEGGLADWTTFTGTETITSDAFAGANALALSSNGSGIDQSFSVIAGETYTLSTYGKTSTDAWSGVGLRFYDAQWNELDGAETPISSADWAEYTVDAIAPTGAVNGILWTWKGGDTGVTTLDEFGVSGATPPSPPPPSADNLLTNPSFEFDLANWNAFTGTETITTDAFAGTQALELSTGSSGANQTIEITAGETYQLTASVKSDNDGWNGIGLRFRDSEGNPLLTEQSRITSGDWSLYDIEGTAPTNATQAEVFIWNGGTSGSTYLDDVTLQSITPPNQAPTITSNGGGTSASLSFEENGTGAIATINATDPEGDRLTYTLEGPDISQISIDSNTGEISFNTVPDFENPADRDRDNQYDVTVLATDSQGAQDTQTLTIEVTDVNLDRSLSLDGRGGIDVEDLTLAGDFTLETWVRFTPGEVIDTRDGFVSSGVYRNGNDINFFSSTPRIYSSSYGFRNDPVIATETATEGQWTHYAFVRDNGVASIYIDGVLNSTSPQPWTSPFVIDEIATAVSAGGLNGELDEFRIWSVARTEAEIDANKDTSIDMNAAGLERYYAFDEGDALIDATGNSSDVPLPSFADLIARTDDPVIPNGSGFVEETIVSGLEQPTAFAYADDGRIFVTEKAGQVKVIENGAVVSTFIDINEEVNSYWDRGLVGIALDPNFDTNGWVYLNYTLDLEPETPDRPDFGADAGGRLIRVQASTTNGNIADITTQEIILDGHEMTEATHTVGDIGFDNDGNLVFSWGDGGFRQSTLGNVQNVDSKQGKFFRVDPDTGLGIPSNPLYDPANPDSVRSKVIALGVRNPWRWSVDRPTGDLYFADVSSNGPEEINIIPATTATNPSRLLNFGWPTSRGTPYVSLPHTGGYDAITGGAVYRGDVYPEAYSGRYFFGNFGPGTLYTADADGNFIQFGNFGEFSGPTDIQLAPDGTINYLSFVDGTLYRLDYNPDAAANQPVIPEARASASVTAGIGPLTVDFSSEGSSSPNGPQLQYQWDFNSDGIPDSTDANPSYTYDTTGRQTAVLTVTDSAGAVDRTKVEVTIVETPPSDGNLALGKPTFQSSNAGDSLSSRAVDGNTDRDFGNGSVAATIAQDKAYWEVDLGEVYDLDSLQVFVGQQARIDMRYILVSENPFSSGNLSAVLAEDGVSSIFNRDAWVDEANISLNRRGRYLRIQLFEFDTLSLAEVKVFGEPI